MPPRPPSAASGASASPEDQRRANLRLALILASVAAIFFIGFVAKIVLLGRG
ncbi:MAG: hypothetical protein QG612_366 [Pseudomonadota bacterium]|nr:hypothetical protein [Pseudomonadota bacterium]